MKKILSLLLALTMLLSICVCGATTASAAENENLCKTFDDELGWFCSLFGESPHSVFDILSRALIILPENPDSFEEVGEEYTSDIIVSKEYFNDLVSKLFELDNGFEELVKQSEDSESLISIDGDKYIIHPFGGFGGGLRYTVRGYIKEGDTYSVFVLPYLAEEGLETDLKQIKDYFKLSDEEAEACIGMTVSGNKVAFFPPYYNGKKVTASYGGEYIKIIRTEKIDSIPALSDMIKPGDPVTTPEPTVPEATVKYEVSAGVKVEGDSAFPSNTVVKVENISAGEIFERVQNALKDIAVADKIAVFEFTATADNTAVQPNGKVKVTFDIPETLSVDGLKMFYISTDGKADEVSITVDKESKTVTAELEHFSTYVLANVKTTEDSTINKPTGDTSIVLPFVLMMVSVVTLAVLVRKRKQEN